MILHVDMDAFYASVEQRDRPELRGQPVIVGGSAEGRGVVCAASYEARKFGVHSAMPAITARRLCPKGIFIPPRMSHYADISSKIRDIFHQFTPLVEPLSLDEAFLDVSGSQSLFGDAISIGQQIKAAILDRLQLVASVGVAPNKFLAKVASDLRKPDALVVVDPDGVQEFLDPLPVGRLWGVGKVTNKALEKIGIRTIQDLRGLDNATMNQLFGEHGDHLWHLARGMDSRPVVPDQRAKSISHETTFAADIGDVEVIRAWLLELSDQLGRRLRRNQKRAKTIHLKVRFADFKTVTRALTLPNATDVTQEISQAALQLFDERIDFRMAIRLLGVGSSGIGKHGVRQQSLFDEPERQQQQQLDAASDLIRQKFGHDALSRGSRLMHNTKHRAQPKPNKE
ncbi:MAG: DNA polymerase IV [Planctomycetota bacterium]